MGERGWETNGEAGVNKEGVESDNKRKEEKEKWNNRAN